MKPKQEEGNWAVETFFGIELFRHLFSLKGLLFIVFIVLVIATWNPFGHTQVHLMGEISDHDSNLPIKSATVSLQDTIGHIISSTESDDSGVFTFLVQGGTDYTIQIEKEGYQTRWVRNTREMNNSPSVVLRIPLTPN